MIVFGLLLASVFLASVWYQSDNSGNGHAVRCLWSLMAFGGSLCCLMSPIMALTALLVSLVATGCLLANASVASFRLAAVAVTVVAFLVCGIVPIHFKEIARLRAAHPFESLSERLAYETRAQPATAQSAITHEASVRLKALESNLSFTVRYSWRAAELKKSHQSYFLHFVNSPDFGVMLTFPKAPSMLFQTVAQSIATGHERGAEPKGEFSIRLAPADHEDPRGASEYRDPWNAERSDSTKKLPVLATTKDSFHQLHRRSLLDFLDPVNYGYVRDRDQVAGFRAHRFESPPVLGGIETPERWQIRRLDLVSLLKHPQPMAYVTDNLPNMDELRKVPVRPLDDIETAMLVQVQAGDDLQLRMTADRIRMLGAIRATNQCLECHHVKRGDLLGAFSYRLSRQP
jgi:hypothetical protein